MVVVEGTGIEEGYITQWALKAGFFMVGGRSAVVNSMKKSPLKGYRNRMEEMGVDGEAVNDENRDNVSKLDELARDANGEWSDPGRFTDDKFMRTINRVYSLVYGERNLLRIKGGEIVVVSDAS
jgi:hypothetical protein